MDIQKEDSDIQKAAHFLVERERNRGFKTILQT